ncbi:MAG: trehalose synthase [Bacteroidetes bacterium]|nr:trehalose synthase [Fibrella sp.]
MPVTPLTTPTAWPDISPLDDLWDDLAGHYLLPYANTCRWFAGKARPQQGLTIAHKHLITETTYLLTLLIDYADGPQETYLLPLAFATDAEADEVPEKGRIAGATLGGRAGWLVDGIYLDRFRRALFESMAQNNQLTQAVGQIDFNRGKGLDASDVSLPSRVLPVDSSNSALVFGDKYFLKLYRKLFPEMNPEVEMVAFISENSDFAHIPAYAGSIVWQVPGHARQRGRSAAPSAMVTLGMMQRMVANDKDSWAQTGDYLNDFLYAVPNRLFTIREDVFDKVELLGRRTAEMHCALYQPTTTDPAFAPEPFTDEYRDFLTRRFEDLLERRYNLLIDNYTKLDPLAQRLAWVFMEAKEMIDEFVADFRTRPLESLRIRIHGDYHLGQVLAVTTDRNNTDFVIIDFEGEPESTIAERKIKHSPLKDVAGMIRSYHYAVSAKLFTADETAGIEPDHLQRVSERWFKLIRDTYLDAYLAEFGTPHALFKNNAEVNFLLLIYLLEKAVYELGYEISYRPAWVKIPLKGILDVVSEIEKIQLADPERSERIPRLQSGLLKNQSA